MFSGEYNKKMLAIAVIENWGLLSFALGNIEGFRETKVKVSLDPNYMLISTCDGVDDRQLVVYKWLLPPSERANSFI